MKVTGRTVLITGASYGIGAATARAMAARGGRVVLLARTRTALEHVADDIRQAGHAAYVYPVDLADADAVACTARQITDEVGTPDIVIHNAGAGRWLSIEETSPREAIEMMAVPYFAAVCITRAFVEDMLRRGEGHFVTVGSPAARIVWPGATAYIASRWALEGFTRALRADLRGTGLRVSLVVPGVVDSTYAAHNPGMQARVPAISNIGRRLSPEEVAEAIVTAVEKNRAVTVLPLWLRLFFLAHRAWPSLVVGIASATGWRRQNGPQLSNRRA